MAGFDGVHPVIGVILKVAIVVILAAVIAMFVFGTAARMREERLQGMSAWTTKELRGVEGGYIDTRVNCEEGIVCYGSYVTPSCIQNFTLAEKLCNCSSGGGS